MSMALSETATLPGSPDWWVARLMPKLARQADSAWRLDEIYRNEADIPVMAPQVRQAYQRLMGMARTNYAELIVEAVRERMTVVGFRTGANADPTGDDAAWALWQANALDADSDLVHRAKLTMGDSFVIVGRDGPDVVITPEDPREVVVDMDPIRRRRVRAAMKVFHDDIADVDALYLYLPGRVLQAQRAAAFASHDDAGPSLETGGWLWQSVETLPGDVVPVVPFMNRSDLYGSTQGEFETHIGHLERINYVILNRLEIATLQAFRQRALKGVPSEDENGNEIDYDDVFAADPGSLWLLPETAELWESGQVDLTPLLMSIKDDIEQLAAVTRTPMHYFSPASANQSAEGASLARESLMFKIRDQLRQTGESWESVMATAFLFAGDTERASRADMEVIWADPERHSMAEQADAATKAFTGGLTWRAVMERIWQLTPQEIDRLETERMNDAMLNRIFSDIENGDQFSEEPPPEEIPPEEAPPEEAPVGGQ
jgi:hypothetical protein